MMRRLSSLGPRGKRNVYVAAIAAGLLAISACQQKMAEQPYFRPLDDTPFFEDGRASRPLEAGTIARNRRPETDPLVTGLVPKSRRIAPKKAAPDEAAMPLEGAPYAVENFVDVFPFRVTEEDLQRGKERFTIYCTPCHSPAGDGRGKIVERSYLKPTNYHYEAPDRPEEASTSTKGLSRGFDRFGLKVVMSPVDLRRGPKVPVAPVGYYFEVISKGFGGMPEHASQIPEPYDRWCIVAYIRTLQLSHAANLNDLPEAMRAEAEKAANEAKTKKAPGEHP